MTRQLMTHKPESKALEKYYLFPRPTMNLTAVLLEEEFGSGGYDADLVRQWAPLALNRLVGKRIARFHGSALNSLVRVLIEQDPVPPQTTTERDAKNYLRRMRRRAFAIVLQDEIEDQSKQMTQEEMQQRISALEASRFADVILERAKQAQNQSGRDKKDNDILSAQDVGGVDFDNAFPDEDGQGVNIEDSVSSSSQQIECDVGESDEDLDGNADAANDIEYHEAAKQMMLLLLDNQMARKAVWKDRDQRCTLRLSEENASAAMKEKEYGGEVKVMAHVEGLYHAPIRKWCRKMHAARDQHPKNIYACPYCSDGDRRTYKLLGSLERHIVNPDGGKRTAEHETLKDEDGWNSDDFFRGLPELHKKDNRKRFIRQVGIEEFPGNRLPELKRARPHEPLANTWYGKLFDSDMVMSLYPNISEGTTWIDDSAVIRQRSKSLVSTGSYEESYQIAEWYDSCHITVDEEVPGMDKVRKWRMRNGLIV